MRVVWDCDCIAVYCPYTAIRSHAVSAVKDVYRTPLPLTCTPYTCIYVHHYLSHAVFRTPLHSITLHTNIYTHPDHTHRHTERNTRSRVHSHPPRLPPPAARSIEEEAQWGGRKKERNKVSESAAGVFTVLPTDAQILQQELIAFPSRQFLCVRKERNEESKGGAPF